MIRVGDRVKVRPNYTLRFAGSTGTVLRVAGERLVAVQLDDHDIPMHFAPHEIVKEGVEIMEDFCEFCGDVLVGGNEENFCSVCYRAICNSCVFYCPVCYTSVCDWCVVEKDGVSMCKLCAEESSEED